MILEEVKESGHESPFQQMLKEVGGELEKIDRIREVIGGKKEAIIELPTIVCIGDQSTGKSSVLESISRVELPKGNHMVTKAPLMI